MARPINSLFNSTSAARSTRGAPIVIPAQITGSSIQPAINTTMPAGPCTLKKLARCSLLLCDAPRPYGRNMDDTGSGLPIPARHGQNERAMALGRKSGCSAAPIVVAIVPPSCTA